MRNTSPTPKELLNTSSTGVSESGTGKNTPQQEQIQARTFKPTNLSFRQTSLSQNPTPTQGVLGSGRDNKK
jgi:hypothetical protein